MTCSLVATIATEVQASEKNAQETPKSTPKESQKESFEQANRKKKKIWSRILKAS